MTAEETINRQAEIGRAAVEYAKIRRALREMRARSVTYARQLSDIGEALFNGRSDDRLLEMVPAMPGAIAISLLISEIDRLLKRKDELVKFLKENGVEDPAGLVNAATSTSHPEAAEPLPQPSPAVSA